MIHGLGRLSNSEGEQRISKQSSIVNAKGWLMENIEINSKLGISMEF
jgi:hypothetical protein